MVEPFIELCNDVFCKENPLEWSKTSNYVHVLVSYIGHIHEKK